MMGYLEHDLHNGQIALYIHRNLSYKLKKIISIRDNYSSERNKTLFEWDNYRARNQFIFPMFIIHGIIPIFRYVFMASPSMVLLWLFINEKGISNDPLNFFEILILTLWIIGIIVIFIGMLRGVYIYRLIVKSVE